MSITCPFVYSKVKGLVSSAAKRLLRLGETLNESFPGIPLNCSNATLEIYIADKTIRMIHKDTIAITPAKEIN